MEIVLVVALLYGTVKAAEWGLRQAGRRGKSAASKHWQAHKAKPRPSAPVSRAGQTLGRAVGAGFHGAVHGTRGFAAGVRAGWPEGKQRAYAWHDRRQAARSVSSTGATVRPFPTPAPQTTFSNWPRRQTGPIAVPHRTDGSSALADDPYSPKQRWIVTADWTDPEAARNPVRYPTEALVHDEDDLRGRIVAGEEMKASGEISDYAVYRLDPADGWTAHLGSPGTRRIDPADYLDDPADELAHPDTESPDHLATVTPITEGNPDMTITTANGGDIQTLSGLLTELEAIEKEATADLEDATNDAQRAKEDGARTEAMLASLSNLKLDSGTLGLISGLGEAAQARAAAAQARQAAAEKRAATASTARKSVQAKHGAIQEASDAAGGMAERAFYQH